MSVLITLMAEALEGTEPIDTLSVPAHLALESAALIYVCKVNIEKIRTCINSYFSWHEELLKKAAVCIIFYVSPTKFKDTI